MTKNNIAALFFGIGSVFGLTFHHIFYTPSETAQVQNQKSFIQVETAPEGRFAKYQEQEENLVVVDTDFKILYYAKLDHSTGKYKIISPVYDAHGQAMRAIVDRER